MNSYMTELAKDLNLSYQLLSRIYKCSRLLCIGLNLLGLFSILRRRRAIELQGFPPQINHLASKLLLCQFITGKIHCAIDATA